MGSRYKQTFHQWLIGSSRLKVYLYKMSTRETVIIFIWHSLPRYYMRSISISHPFSHSLTNRPTDSLTHLLILPVTSSGSYNMLRICRSIARTLKHVLIFIYLFIFCYFLALSWLWPLASLNSWMAFSGSSPILSIIYLTITSIKKIVNKIWKVLTSLLYT